MHRRVFSNFIYVILFKDTVVKKANFTAQNSKSFAYAVFGLEFKSSLTSLSVNRHFVSDLMSMAQMHMDKMKPVFM